MIFSKSPEPADSLARQALHSVEGSITATERAASDALDSLAHGVHQVVPRLNRAGDQISALAQHGLDNVRDGSRQLRQRAERLSETTVSYVRVEPVKAILMAAATGAALMALLNVLSRARRRA